MTASNDLDRALGAWFDAVTAATPPPEPLARLIDATRRQRPRPSLVAGLGSGWVAGGSKSGVGGSTATLRTALVALVILVLAAGAVLIGGRLITPAPRHVYLDELVSAPDLSTPISAQALVPFGDGRVLVVGDGRLGRGTTAVVYDPATGASMTAGPMAVAVSWVSSSVLLRDGRVLFLGDTGIQIFDPATMRFAPVGPMITPRSGGAAALLHDGRVLIAGGMPPGGSAGLDPAIHAAELFDPATLTFAATGPIGTATGGGPMVTLPDGRVFMATDPTSEIYDPATGTFSPTGTTSPVTGGQPIILADGRVVLVGSTGLFDGGRVRTFDPASQTHSTRDLPEPLTGATLLDDGRVLLIGMCRGRPLGWTGVYDPTTGVATPTQGTRACRPASTRLPDGRVLIVGGVEPAVPTVEIFR
jgi:hypothetical protein